MKCTKCNGYGYIDNLEGDGLKCPKCNGTGEFGQTNVDWLRSATFEEIAEEIHKWYIFGYAMGLSRVKRNPITGVVKWLKAPHTEKE